MRKALLAISLLGLLIFGSGFVVSFLNPILIEGAAREIVRIEVESEVGRKIEKISDSRIVGIAQRALAKVDVDIQNTKKSLREEVPRKVAATVAAMLDADCECRRRRAEREKRSEEARLSSLMQLREHLQDIIESAYVSVASSLMRELRIFSSSNATAFALLGIVTFTRKKSAIQLFLPAVVLLGAVIITGGLYLFNQNWLHTIIFGQYVGLAYCMYLPGVALLLTDVAFNQAKVSTGILKSVFENINLGDLSLLDISC